MLKRYQKMILANIDKLSISELKEILGESNFKGKKDEIVKIAKKELKDNELMIIKLYKDYNKRFALSWGELEDIVDCTKTERLRWIKEEKIKVSYTKSFYKYGKTFETPYYDMISVYEAKKSAKKWRKIKEKEILENRKKGAVKREETKKENEKIRESFRDEFKKILASWYRVDSKAAVTYELAYWTTWASRWAKESQLKKYNAKKIETREKYEADEKYFYKLKNEANKLLMRSSISELSFYEPEYPDKVTELHFCDYHYERWLDMREFQYVTKWEFLDFSYDDIVKCKDCTCKISKGYYSLYFLEIKDERIKDFSFGFHVPYPIGRGFLPKPKSLKKVEHMEQDGVFRFGRPVFDDEKIVYTEKFVKRKMEEAIDKFRLYFPEEVTEVG